MLSVKRTYENDTQYKYGYDFVFTICRYFFERVLEYHSDNLMSTWMINLHRVEFPKDNL